MSSARVCPSTVEKTECHQGLKSDDLATNNDQSESEKLAQIDLVANLAETLAGLLTIYNSLVREIQSRENEDKEDKLTMSRLTDLIR